MLSAWLHRHTKRFLTSLVRYEYSRGQQRWRPVIGVRLKCVYCRRLRELSVVSSRQTVATFIMNRPTSSFVCCDFDFVNLCANFLPQSKCRSSGVAICHVFRFDLFSHKTSLLLLLYKVPAKSVHVFAKRWRFSDQQQQPRRHCVTTRHFTLRVCFHSEAVYV